MVQFQWLMSCLFREKLRRKYGLPAEPCADCCVHYWCEPCALCQEYAELKSRGWDPAKGYEAQKMVPPMPASMKKCMPF
uniref:Uncharacterized protein n=1 Tax=Kalanchoe fedtschenkoi TaxID=63787 RepID=A0A7N1A4I7_KALFE